MMDARTEAISLPTVDEPTDAIRLTIDPERIAALADDIAAQGQLQEVGVRGPSPEGRYEIIWGHRRLLALRLLERDAIRARVFPWDVDPLHARTMENFGQERMTPLEEAEVCRRYMLRYANVSAVARLVRHSHAWVNARLALLEYPPDLQQAVQDGDIPLGVAQHLKDVDHDGYRGDLIKEAVRAGASTAVVAAWVAHYHADRERLVHNHVTIEQMAAERATFILKQICEGCRAEVDATTIRALHLCKTCGADIRQALAEAASTNGAPRS